MPTYVFTDVHGRADLLGEALEWIAAAARGRSLRLIGLGDYVDRGPMSAAVVEMLARARNEPGWEVVLLQGNHDRMMVDAVAGDAGMRELWLANGGLATLQSYGAAPGELSSLARHPHYRMLRELPLSFEDEERIYVHAGLRPGVPLARQSPSDLQWIREPFLSSSEDFGKLVIHGHTPVDGATPDVRRNRINLDTGACFPGGCLTVARWDDGESVPVFRSFP